MPFLKPTDLVSLPFTVQLVDIETDTATSVAVLYCAEGQKVAGWFGRDCAMAAWGRLLPVLALPEGAGGITRAGGNVCVVTQ